MLLEQLIAPELEGALEEVAGRGGTEAGPDGADALAGYHLAETADETAVVFYGVELYPGFDSGFGARQLLFAFLLCFWGSIEPLFSVGGAYTSTGVRPPWVTEQQTAPARANREYNWKPLSLAGDAALAFWTTASSFVEPVEEGGGDAAMVIGLRGE